MSKYEIKKKDDGYILKPLKDKNYYIILGYVFIAILIIDQVFNLDLIDKITK